MVSFCAWYLALDLAGNLKYPTFPNAGTVLRSKSGLRLVSVSCEIPVNFSMISYVVGKEQLAVSVFITGTLFSGSILSPRESAYFNTTNAA